MTQQNDHEHEFLGTYLRTIGDEKFVMYSGEKDTDEFVLMCDCGEIRYLAGGSNNGPTWSNEPKDGWRA